MGALRRGPSHRADTRIGAPSGMTLPGEPRVVHPSAPSHDSDRHSADSVLVLCSFSARRAQGPGRRPDDARAARRYGRVHGTTQLQTSLRRWTPSPRRGAAELDAAHSDRPGGSRFHRASPARRRQALHLPRLQPEHRAGNAACRRLVERVPLRSRSRSGGAPPLAHRLLEAPFMVAVDGGDAS